MKHVSVPPALSLPSGDAVLGRTSVDKAPPARGRARERNYAQGILFACNVLGTLSLLAALVIMYFSPDRLAHMHVTEQQAQMFTLNVISLLLLVAWLQRNLTGAWRAFTLAAAFIVLAESWLVGLT